MMSSYSSLTLVLLCLSNICFSEATNCGFSVEMVHRDSPGSPFYRSTETRFQRAVNALRRSIKRINHSNLDTVETTVKPDGGEYLISYSVGTPPFQLFGTLDTGSSIIWLQCLPCKPCYKQTTPIFKPSNSKTYKPLSCTSSSCKSMQGTTCSFKNPRICEYTIQYGDGSYSEGDVSLETLTLESTDEKPFPFPNTVIGCGRSNSGLFGANSSGIVGLGRGASSLISQLSSSIDGKFSYCLTPMFSQLNSSSKLSFGDAAVVSGGGTVSTPIVTKVPKEFYFLTLEGFSVGGKTIGFGGEGNVIIDSGTTLTLLPSDVYDNLEAEVKDVVKLERVDDPSGVLSLCYKYSESDEGDLPEITANFRDAEVKLKPINTFVEVADGILCLAFQSSPELFIFGNLAQQNIFVGYDLIKETVSFKPTDCTKL